MWKKLIGWALGKAINKWILGGVVTVLLSVVSLTWYNFKQDLRDEGTQICIQEINAQTMLTLQNALAAEKLVAADLRARVAAAATVNQEARFRLKGAETKVASLLKAQKEQEKTDETYADWSNTALPDGVADRLRDAQSGRDTDTSTRDSN